LQVLLATSLGNIPWIIPYINKVLPYIPIPALQKMINGRAGLRQVSALLSLDAWGLTRTKLAITSVNRRIAGDSRRKDLLGRLLEELQRGVDSKGNVLDVKDIQTEAFGFIVAGSHTTAATISFLMWHFFHNNTALSRLQDEIRAVTPSEDNPCYPYSALASLPYLQASISENFRISPVFVMPLMRVVPEGGKVIAGQFVPAGVDVSVCNHVLHHDPDVFGADLESFIPERWFKGDYNKSQYAFWSRSPCLYLKEHCHD
jgi:benzoate 4-monooxygenase